MWEIDDFQIEIAEIKILFCQKSNLIIFLPFHVGKISIFCFDCLFIFGKFESKDRYSDSMYFIENFLFKTTSIFYMKISKEEKREKVFYTE